MGFWTGFLVARFLFPRTIYKEEVVFEEKPKEKINSHKGCRSLSRVYPFGKYDLSNCKQAKMLNKYRGK